MGVPGRYAAFSHNMYCDTFMYVYCSFRKKIDVSMYVNIGLNSLCKIYATCLNFCIYIMCIK